MQARGATLTTGANSGIGLATVLELARRGFRSVGTVRSVEKAEVVARAADVAGVKVETRVLDVTDAERGTEVVNEIRPDVLVNNAGYSIMGAIEDVPDDDVRRAFETMVLAPMRLARLATTTMRERGGGRILNVSSIYGRTTTPLAGWYQGCKHALEATSDALRTEVARDRIHVILVEPGGFRTGIWEGTASEIEERSGSRYDDSYSRTLTAARLTQPFMGDPSGCARVIAHAATTRWPRTRYLVGLDALGLALWSVVTPTRVKDEIVRRVVGL